MPTMDEENSSSLQRSLYPRVSPENRNMGLRSNSYSKFKMWSAEGSVEPLKGNMSVDSPGREISPFDGKYERGDNQRNLAVEIDTDINRNIKSKELVKSLLAKLKDLSNENLKILKENQNLTKVNKKLDTKASDRKKTLKQLYALLTEKDKELNFYKSNFLVGLSKSEYSESLVEPESAAKTIGGDMDIIQKYQALEAKLDMKGAEIDRLTDMVVSLSAHKKIPEKKDFVLNISPITTKSRRVSLFSLLLFDPISISFNIFLNNVISKVI